MTTRLAVALGLAAAVLTAAAVFAGLQLSTVNLPVILFALILGPFALVYLVLPAVTYPLLVSKLPLARRRLGAIAVLTVVVLSASAVYLSLSEEYPGNIGREPGLVLLILVAFTLVTLGGITYLRESRALTCVYHAVLTVWFFAAAFPYLGEFP